MSSLLCLPTEIITLICDYLPNSSIKALRLTCKKACNIARLRLNQVLLSANLLNIYIADSETFRHNIKEIIWDNACFIKALSSELDLDIEYVTTLIRQDVDRPALCARAEQIATQLPLRTCWQY
ncbi:hypothetical protein BDW59DRAFT_162396 [Aspergillus cavernicola]|uniref:F-box domain-containing protein n=1 Tax=Aspergillus cavernicola TaxID=176166 RepID=A0ABR4I9S2_9EURO